MALIWKGVTIERRASDGFVNATQMCRAGGVRFNDWYRSAKTAALIEVVKSNASYPVLKPVDIKVGGNHAGSWIHEDLAIQLAQWISAEFAICVSRWTRQLLHTGSVTLESKEVAPAQDAQRELERYKSLLQEKEEELSRLHVLHAELLTYKKNRLKEESLYIVSTVRYAKQGIFKIGRTRQRMKMRSSGHNVCHVAGDKIKVLHEFKVGDSALVEKNVHGKLRGLLLQGEQEFFMCPYRLLLKLVSFLVRHDNRDNEAVNTVIEAVDHLRRKKFDSSDWTEGIPEEFFADELEEKAPPVVRVSAAGNVLAEFDLSDYTAEEQRAFVEACVRDFVALRRARSLVWTSFQQFLVERLRGPKKAFRALEWRKVAKEVAEAKELSFVVKQVRAIAN